MNKYEIEQIITNTYSNHNKNTNIGEQLELFKSKQGCVYQEFLEFSVLMIKIYYKNPI